MFDADNPDMIHERMYLVKHLPADKIVIVETAKTDTTPISIRCMVSIQKLAEGQMVRQNTVHECKK